jgi:glycosyltransferase involved in cell wall biosynthesis
LESLACGTPVLVTPAGGLPETVTALDPSLVLSGSDGPALASGLQRGLLEPLPDAMKCRRYIEARFTWSAIARRVLEVYQEALP